MEHVIKIQSADVILFSFGDILYRKTNGDLKGMVTGFLIGPSSIKYGVSWEDGKDDWHHGMELTRERPIE